MLPPLKFLAFRCKALRSQKNTAFGSKSVARPLVNYASGSPPVPECSQHKALGTQFTIQDLRIRLLCRGVKIHKIRQRQRGVRSRKTPISRHPSGGRSSQNIPTTGKMGFYDLGCPFLGCWEIGVFRLRNPLTQCTGQTDSQALILIVVCSEVIESLTRGSLPHQLLPWHTLGWL